jgi:hypothetical protein
MMLVQEVARKQKEEEERQRQTVCGLDLCMLVCMCVYVRALVRYMKHICTHVLFCMLGRPDGILLNDVSVCQGVQGEGPAWKQKEDEERRQKDVSLSLCVCVP